MRNLRQLDRHRISNPEIIAIYGSAGDHQNGFFVLESPIDRAELKVIASVGEGWEHVSVSRKKRCPNWPEMEFVKRAFFDESETVVQLHVPPSEHINVHSFCLHLWRPLFMQIPRPPGWMVAV